MKNSTTKTSNSASKRLEIGQIDIKNGLKIIVTGALLLAASMVLKIGNQLQRWPGTGFHWIIGMPSLTWLWTSLSSATRAGRAMFPGATTKAVVRKHLHENQIIPMIIEVATLYSRPRAIAMTFARSIQI